MASTTSRQGGGVPASIMAPRLILLLSALALALIGLVMVYSASFVEAIHEGESSASYLVKQLAFAGVGVVCAAALWKFAPPSLWRGPAVWAVWGLSLVLLVLTAAIGTVGLGAQRWLSLGPLGGIQPSEFAKIAFVLMAARILYDYRSGTLSPRDMLVQAFLLIIAPILLLYKSQSDLGTTMICVVGVIAVMWLGEVPTRTVLALCAIVAAFAVVAIFFVGYRADRFSYLDPWNDGYDGYGTGYQIIHSFYAFAEGGLFGVGLGNSREKYLYLPEAETDFIFAVVGEELGLVGALVVIALFLLFLYAGLRIARAASDGFGAMVAGSLTVMIAFQAFLNIGCVIGLFPTTGKPLPFISSGGSSLIATFIMVGLILSVSEDAAAPSVYERRRADLRVVRAVQPGPPPGAGLDGRGRAGRPDGYGGLGGPSRRAAVGRDMVAGGSAQAAAVRRSRRGSR